MTDTRQRALPFPQPQRYAPEDYLAGDCNAAALAWLADPAAWPALRLAVYGPPGCGKTHLLHLFAAARQAAFYPAEAVHRLEPPPSAPALAIDDADTVTDARALLHLLNGAAERGMPVLLAGRAPPAAWNVALPDLASRLRAVTAVALGVPEDDLLRPLLARLLADRQLRVSEQLQDFMLARLPRSGGALREAAARLDLLSLAAGGTVTRAMAAAVIDELAGAEPDAGTKKGPGDAPPGHSA